MKRKKQWEQALEAFPADAVAEKIESTARVLEGMNYEPVLLLKTPGFLRMGKRALCDEIGRVVDLLPEQMLAAGFGLGANYEEWKARHIQLLLYHYGLLCRLRDDEPAAWDTIYELYEDD